MALYSNMIDASNTLVLSKLEMAKETVKNTNLKDEIEK